MHPSNQSEAEFLASYKPEKYKRPSLTADAAVLTWRNEQIQILLIQRGNHPFKGMWATPGGFVEFGETLESCIVRELEEETGIKASWVRQLGAYSDPDRDPRPHIITVMFYTAIPATRLKPKAGDDAASARWFNLYRLPKLACDHNKICADLRKQLRVDFHDINFAKKFLPHSHAESDLLQLYKTVYGRQVSKRDIQQLNKSI